MMIGVRVRLIAGALCAAYLSGCAARLPVVTTPAYPGYPFPEVPEELAGTPAAAEHERAWLFLQAGDLAESERRFGEVLRRDPAFHPAEAGLGFVELARGRGEAAVARFAGALARTPTYVPALLGRGEALLFDDRVDEAIESFRAALAVDPGLSAIRQRVEELRFTGLTDQVARARAASVAGRDTEARAAYERLIAASPDSGFLYLELAAVERRQGDTAAALDRVERALELDPNAVPAWLLMSEIYLDSGDLDRAEQALLRAEAIEPNVEIARRLAALEARRRDARLPPEYFDIEAAEAITRGQLAVLIGVRFETLLGNAAAGRPVIITDTRDYWGYTWVIAVAGAGIMEADTNYRFQPERQVTRTELADVAVRLLRYSGGADQPSGPRPIFSDMTSGHLSYPAAADAVAAGVLEPLDRDAFQPSRLVGGAEAVAALGRVGILVGGGRLP